MHVFRQDWNFPGAREAQDPLRIEVLEPTWDIGQGQHPDMEINASFYDPKVRNPFYIATEALVPELLTQRPQGAVTGHTMASDGNSISLSQPNANVPIAPLFVRDLAGRTIYLGITKHQQEPLNHRFPQGSLLLPESTHGYDLLEQIYFCPFRFVEPSATFKGSPSDDPLNHACAIYRNANLYPYKLRLDTFYQEGWRLPQTELLFVNADVTTTQTAETAGTELINLWHNRPQGEQYEAFITKHSKKITAFFNAGCTLIPTIEAFNGINIVDEQYNHQGFWPGRAVQGLHEVIAQKDDPAPAGTIIEVLDPGYISATETVPARVIISNGQKYVSPVDPYKEHQKVYPDLRLPHQRTTGKWGETWLPVHPKDFETPALWGWDHEHGDGRFMQLSGPLWDPLHYYYACTKDITHAFENNRIRKNFNLVKVPEEALNRFYPIIEMRGFDTFNTYHQKAQEEALSLLPSMVTWHADAAAHTKIGYHPLPQHYEFELDNWWFPKLTPKCRVPIAIPLNIENNLTEVIHPRISPEKFLNTCVNDVNASPWVTESALLSPPQPQALENYPELKKYLQPANTTKIEMAELSFTYLEYVELEDCPLLEFELSTIQKLEKAWPGVYQILLTASAWSKTFINARHTLFKNKEAYIKAQWEGTPFTELMSKTEKTTTSKKLPSAALMGTQ